MAGWVYILLRRPFRVGDRIEVDGTSGDVIDVRLFRFTLMEIGNWVHADQSTGRIVHVPNGVLFTNQVANYTEGFAYIWHEVPVLVTFESDWEHAERIVLEAIQHASTEIVAQATRGMRDTARTYQLTIGTLTPVTYLTVQDSGVLVTGRYLVEVQGRRAAEQRVWKAILRSIAATSDVELAYPTMRTYFQGPLQPSGPGSGPPSEAPGSRAHRTPAAEPAPSRLAPGCPPLGRRPPPSRVRRAPRAPRTRALRRVREHVVRDVLQGSDAHDEAFRHLRVAR